MSTTTDEEVKLWGQTTEEDGLVGVAASADMTHISLGVEGAGAGMVHLQPHEVQKLIEDLKAALLVAKPVEVPDE